MVKLEVNDRNGFFYIEVNGRTEAKMTFVFAGEDKIIMDHPELNPAYEGKDFGIKMLEKAVFFAREKDVKIILRCSFAKSVFEKFPEFKDVL